MSISVLITVHFNWNLFNLTILCHEDTKRCVQEIILSDLTIIVL